MEVLATQRLILRRWRDADREPFAAMNSDPRVMAFYPRPLTRTESNRLIDRIDTHFHEHGFGLYAVEIAATGVFAGYIGLAVPEFSSAFTPCVEIGWRFDVQYWGQGFATEGAREVVQHAFTDLGLNRIVSFTVPANHRSRRVMEKIGMTHDPSEDFDHPSLPVGHPLRRHVLYRLHRVKY